MRAFILYVLANKSFNFESDIIYGTPSVFLRAVVNMVRTFRFHNMLGNSGVAAQLAAPQRHCSMEVIS
jgi:hypothetical protein